MCGFAASCEQLAAGSRWLGAPVAQCASWRNCMRRRLSAGWLAGGQRHSSAPLFEKNLEKNNSKCHRGIRAAS